MKKNTILFGTAIGMLALSASANADQVILDDLIVDGSACIGQDCVNGESFGFDTIRLKENNLRIKFQDTSSSASFPTNDWQLTANDSSNGGQNKFSIDDIDGGKTPFTVEAGARTNALYVEADGDVGFGTKDPVVNLHVMEGNTPTLRLEQDGSSGFTPQTWDVAGNETNFFVRDATNGSRLPFKIKPSAPTNSLYVKENGDIGMETANPQGKLHVTKNGILLTLMESTSDDAVQIRMKSDSINRRFLAVDSGDIAKSQIIFGDDEITFAGQSAAPGALYLIANATGLTVPNGSITVGATVVHPDYVFEKDYELMSLRQLRSFIDENHHLPEVPSAKEVAIEGINMTSMQITLLKKVEELTLYTLNQQETIDDLQRKLAKLNQ